MCIWHYIIYHHSYNDIVYKPFWTKGLTCKNRRNPLPFVFSHSLCRVCRSTVIATVIVYVWCSRVWRIPEWPCWFIQLSQHPRPWWIRSPGQLCLGDPHWPKQGQLQIYLISFVYFVSIISFRTGSAQSACLSFSPNKIPFCRSSLDWTNESSFDVTV